MKTNQEKVELILSNLIIALKTFDKEVQFLGFGQGLIDKLFDYTTQGDIEFIMFASVLLQRYFKVLTDLNRENVKIKCDRLVLSYAALLGEIKKFEASYCANDNDERKH
jgi:hypothetical protein